MKKLLLIIGLIAVLTAGLVSVNVRPNGVEWAKAGAQANPQIPNPPANCSGSAQGFPVGYGPGGEPYYSAAISWCNASAYGDYWFTAAWCFEVFGSGAGFYNGPTRLQLTPIQESSIAQCPSGWVVAYNPSYPTLSAGIGVFY